MATKKCRVCGKEYEACRTNRRTSGFNWKEVACSPECGSKYLEAVLRDRGLLKTENTEDLIPENEAFEVTLSEDELIENEESDNEDYL